MLTQTLHVQIHSQKLEASFIDLFFVAAGGDCFCAEAAGESLTFFCPFLLQRTTLAVSRGTEPDGRCRSAENDLELGFLPENSTFWGCLSSSWHPALLAHTRSLFSASLLSRKKKKSSLTTLTRSIAIPPPLFVTPLSDLSKPRTERRSMSASRLASSPA